MPRRTKLRRHASGWNGEHVRILQSGLDWLGEFRDEIDQHSAWQELKSEILRDWLKDHPGTRPWGWWAFDIPRGSRRECVNGRHPFDDPGYDLQKKLYFGRPQFNRPSDMLALYEPEAQLLRRHSLLSAVELKALSGE